MEISVLFNSLIETIQCLNITLKDNESLNNIEAIGSDYNNKNHKSIPIMFPTHQQLLLEYCMTISAICLAMHLIVYSFVPKLRNTPGKCLMSLSLSLLLAAIMFIMSFHINASPNNFLCLSVALIRLYSFLAAFCWMNVMAYDVFKTFAKSSSSFRNKSSKMLTRYERNCSFIKYSAYAWLLPAIIVIISLIVQANVPFDSPYSPAFGKTICGISHFAAMLIYFMFPVTTILTINVILFIITARKLKMAANETRIATKSRAKYHLLLHIKLVLVLGLTWIFGFIAMFIKVPLISYPSIVLHGLHGAFIFVAFTLRRNVYRLIVLRIKYLRGDTQIRISTVKLNDSNIRPKSRVRSFDTRSDTLITLWSENFRDRCYSI